LTDTEYDRYLEWKANENEQKVATISDIDQKKAEKVATISAYQIIDQYQKVLLA